MRRDDRLTAILDLLGQEGTLDVDRIVEAFGVSPATARRDLDALASRRFLTRTRGGAAAAAIAYDLPLRYKREREPDAKAAIARAAQALIPAGSSVGLSGGTTCTAIAAELGQRDDVRETGVSVVTNALNIAMQLAIVPGVRVVVTGGAIHARSYELVGPLSDLVLSRLSLDVALLGVNGLDATVGATVHDEGEARVNGLLAERAREAWIVADSSKIGVRTFATVAPLSAFRGVVTDAALPDDARAWLEDAGLEIRIA